MKKLFLLKFILPLSLILTFIVSQAASPSKIKSKSTNIKQIEDVLIITDSSINFSTSFKFNNLQKAKLVKAYLDLMINIGKDENEDISIDTQLFDNFNYSPSHFIKYFSLPNNWYAHYSTYDCYFLEPGIVLSPERLEFEHQEGNLLDDLVTKLDGQVIHTSSDYPNKYIAELVNRYSEILNRAKNNGAQVRLSIDDVAFKVDPLD